MGFEIGNEYGGRKKGAVNKSNANVKAAFQKLLDDNLEGIQADLDSLDPKDRIAAILNLAGYIVPKLKASDIKFERPPDQPLFLMPEEMEEMKNISDEAFKEVTGRDKSCIDGYED